MSYACSGVPRVAYFSNPLVTMSNGEVTGTATANTALTMTNTMSTVAAFMTPVVATLPNAPGNLAAVANSSSQITLTWSDGSSGITGFLLEKSTDGVNFSQFATVAGNVFSYASTGLAGSTAYYYRARAYNSAGDSSYSNTGTATTAAAVADTTPPVVTIVNPKAGATVSGVVSVSVNASDNVSVKSTTLYIDGKLVATASVGSLSYSWNTKKVASGSHAIKALAVDPSGNIGSKSITVTK